MPALRISALVTLCLIAGEAFCGLGQGVPPARHTEDPAEIIAPMPRYLLQDPRGRVLTQESFRGRFQLITFGFTSCPDVCPTALLGFKIILDALGNQAERVQPLFITVDPERDTTELLREYTTAFHPSIVGLRGSPELLQRAAQSFRVRYEKVREPGAAADIYTMDHSTGMYLLDGEGRFLAKFASTAPPREVASRIRGYLATDRSGAAGSRRSNAPLR